MRNGKYYIVVAAIGLLSPAFAGCANKSAEPSENSYYASAVSMESTPIVDYAVPEYTPNILVDFEGYQADGEKQAAIKADELPKTFRLVDNTTKKVVYTGAVEEVSGQSESEQKMGYAEFSEFTQAGEYYLECDTYGRSYSFPIVENLYQKQFEELRDKVQEKCELGTVEVDEIIDLLTAYEWYPDLFPDKDKDQVPDVFLSVVPWTQNLEIGEEEESVDVKKATALVKFSYLYQKFDRKYATTCLQRGSALYKQSQKNIHKDAESFFALTELYRATGQYTYRIQIEDYKSFFENNNSLLEEDEYLYGAMTYMVTRQKVNVELCNIFMKLIKDRGEEVSHGYHEMIHPILARNNGMDEILKRAGEIMFINYVLPSYQYNNILMECMHYLGGQNQKATNIYRSEENTGCLLVLAQLASIQK